VPRTAWLPLYLWVTAKQCFRAARWQDFAKVIGNLQLVQVIPGFNPVLFI
jgi:hypothetical protein